MHKGWKWVLRAAKGGDCYVSLALACFSAYV